MSGWYTNGLAEMMRKSIDLDSDTIRVMLVGSGYTFNPDHDFVSDVTPGTNEVVDAGGGTVYARKTLANPTITNDDGNNRAKFDADDVTWAALKVDRDIDAAIIYQRVGADDSTPADDVLLAYIDDGGFPVVSNGGDITIQWSANGILLITV